MAYNDKTTTFHPVFIALKRYKSINIFRTNDKIFIACYSYNMDIFFLVLISLLLFSLPEGSENKETKISELGKYISYCTLSRAITITYYIVQHIFLYIYIYIFGRALNEGLELMFLDCDYFL